VTVFEVGDEDAALFIVMECVEGGDLARARREGRLSLAKKIAVLLQLLDALEFAHRAGVVHGGLKPSKVHVTPDLRVKVRGFGVARAVDAGTLATASPAADTLFYASPEQLRGDRVDLRSDVYSAGVIAYEMFAGRADLSAFLDRSHAAIASMQPEIDEEMRRIADQAAMIAAERIGESRTLLAANPDAVGLRKLLDPIAAARARP
jgi:eukaryotic-like serine/threonine-protein kinase